jgi:hypothetical protein
MSLRAARRDFGRLGLAVMAMAALLVLVGSLVDVHRARGWYMSIVSFHAYLEIACLAFLAGRSSQQMPEASSS